MGIRDQKKQITFGPRSMMYHMRHCWQRKQEAAHCNIIITAHLKGIENAVLRDFVPLAHVCVQVSEDSLRCLLVF